MESGNELRSGTNNGFVAGELENNINIVEEQKHRLTFHNTVVTGEERQRSTHVFCGSPRQWCIELIVGDEETKPSNETLLLIAFVTFLLFAVCQTVASILAESKAMLGDSAAMLVDSFTYGFNLYAERKKPDATRKERLQLELIPPFISVTSLVGVTAYVISDALGTLLDGHDGDDPNTTVMAVFSTVNLLLDIVNIFCFAKARHFLGFTVSDTGTSLDHIYDHHVNATEHCKTYLKSSEGFLSEEKQISNEGIILYQGVSTDNSTDNEFNADANHREFASMERKISVYSDVTNTVAAFPDDDELFVGGNDDAANLNMCSAYTHVFADTVRSIAVMIAALVAGARDDVDAENADAIAAIIVSIFILISLGPLVRGMIYTWTELKACELDEEFELIDDADDDEDNTGNISTIEGEIA